MAFDIFCTLERRGQDSVVDSLEIWVEIVLSPVIAASFSPPVNIENRLSNDIIVRAHYDPRINRYSTGFGGTTPVRYWTAFVVAGFDYTLVGMQILDNFRTIELSGSNGDPVP